MLVAEIRPSAGVTAGDTRGSSGNSVTVSTGRPGDEKSAARAARGPSHTGRSEQVDVAGAPCSAWSA
jgi:hypothetical protein